MSVVIRCIITVIALSLAGVPVEAPAAGKTGKIKKIFGSKSKQVTPPKTKPKKSPKSTRKPDNQAPTAQQQNPGSGTSTQAKTRQAKSQQALNKIPDKKRVDSRSVVTSGGCSGLTKSQCNAKLSGAKSNSTNVASSTQKTGSRQRGSDRDSLSGSNKRASETGIDSPKKIFRRISDKDEQQFVRKLPSASSSRKVGNNGKSADTLQPGPFASESIPARGPSRNFSKAERDQINEIGYRRGCHTCGSKKPGTKSGNFILDHQPANALNTSGAQQNLYPHCKGCSARQAGQVTQAKRKAKQ